MLNSNYAMRQARLAPDEWFWADTVLLLCGYNYGISGRPEFGAGAR
jgi:hypothetical protein